MKRVFVMLLLVFAAAVQLSVARELIHFRDTTSSWEEIKSIASKEHKLIFIDAYTDWCSWCKVMDRETFSDTVVADFLNEKFIPVQYEMETGFGSKMSAKYHVSGFPTFLIFTPDGKLVGRLLGYQKSKEFLENLSNALDPSKYYNLTGLSASLDPGYPEFYKRSFVKKELRVRPDTATVLSFLRGQKDLSGEVAWSVMFRFSGMLTEPYKKFVYANYDRLKKMYGPGDVESAVAAFISSDLDNAIKANDETSLEKVIVASGKYLGAPSDDMRFSYRLRFYRGTNRWRPFADLIDSARNSANKPDENVINSYSWAIYELCSDKDIISRATKWMSEAVVTSPRYMLLDTYAALLFKNGEMKKAKQFAETAIETGKQEKEDVSETQELLKKINASLEKKL